MFVIPMIFIDFDQQNDDDNNNNNEFDKQYLIFLTLSLGGLYLLNHFIN